MLTEQDEINLRQVCNIKEGKKLPETLERDFETICRMRDRISNQPLTATEYAIIAHFSGLLSIDKKPGRKLQPVSIEEDSL